MKKFGCLLLLLSVLPLISCQGSSSKNDSEQEQVGAARTPVTTYGKAVAAAKGVSRQSDRHADEIAKQAGDLSGE